MLRTSELMNKIEILHEHTLYRDSHWSNKNWAADMFITLWRTISLTWDSEYPAGCFNSCNWIIFRDFFRVSFGAAAQIVLSGSVTGLSAPSEQLWLLCALLRLCVARLTAGANLSLAFPHKRCLCGYSNNGRPLEASDQAVCENNDT